MKSYENPSLDDRRGRAVEAKSKALEQLRNRPPIDAAAAAERQAARSARDTAKREKSDALKADQANAKEEAKRAQPVAAAPAPSEAELKAARDARYAARKNRR